MKYNKEKILMIVGVITLLVFVGGATYAYFVAQGDSSEQTGVNVLTHTTDSLVFEVGKAISITADQTSFAPGAGNRSDDTFARATLKANSSTNSATANYYVYLNIDTNEFKYTTDTKTAELILTVNYKDNEGNITPVTSINGLNYVTVGEVSGFDITEEQNLITIANNYEITSTGTKVDEWEVTLTLVNLDANQNANTGKTFNATLMIQKEMVASQYIASLFTTQGANHLYHHDGTITDAEGNIIDAEDGSYRYAGGDYTIASQYQETYKRITKVATTGTDALLGFICGAEEKLPTALCNEETHYFYLTYEMAETKTQYATYKEALNKLIEDGYLEETPVKNYVCFGDDCTNPDNLYRIIGAFENNIKLIKADYAGSNLLGENGDYSTGNSNQSLATKKIFSKYLGSLGELFVYHFNLTNYSLAYDETGYRNVWSYSELNKTNLNLNFLNNIGNKWSNMIKPTTWYLNGLNNVNYLSKVKNVFEYELGKKRIDTYPFEPYKAKVGLMYVSDYLYAANSDKWELPARGNETNDYRNVEDDWIKLGGNLEFTISRLASQYIWILGQQGLITNMPINTPVNVRPTFYLKSSVTFNGGSGTETDPYRIA